MTIYGELIEKGAKDIGGIFNSMSMIILLLIPLALWKVIDIIIFLFKLICAT